MRPRYWHYWLSSLLLVGLIPVLRSQNLPLKFDWITLGVAFWLILAAQSIFVAVLLALIGLRGAETWQPFIARCRENPVHAVVILVFFAVLVWTTTILRGFVLTVDAVALLEMVQRRQRKDLKRTLSAILIPAAYLFFGFLLVLAYNCAIVSARFNFAYDPALSKIDRWILFGHSVSGLTHWAVQAFPLSFFRALEFIYFGMFPQIGAAIILVALGDGKMRALQLIGTILLSYYLALAIFYIAPAQGPYYLCPAHFSRFPSSLQSWNVQHTLIPHALALWRHQPIRRISTDYFIAFPCMHIVQPIIVLWFLRRWKRMVYALAAYDVLLVVAILLLEMHYIVDFIAGIVVALLAIAITDGALRRRDSGVLSGAESAG